MSDIIVILNNLTSHKMGTITPKEDFFGEHFKTVEALCTAIDGSNLIRIVSHMGIEKFQNGFFIKDLEGNDLDVDYEKLSELAETLELNGILKNAGLPVKK